MKQRMKRLVGLWLAVLLLVSVLVMPASAGYSTPFIPGYVYFTTETVVAGEYLQNYDLIPAWLPYGVGAPSIDEFLEDNGITVDDMMRDGKEPTGWRIWSSTSSGRVGDESFDLELGESISQQMYESLDEWQWHDPCIEALYDENVFYEDLGAIIYFENAADDIHFVDVDKNSAYYDAIMNAASKGWMKGVSPTQFAPDASLTRAMIWTILARANGQRTDGDGEWYGIGRQWAMRNDISDGTNPNGTLTQEELITMVWRSVGSPYCVADVTNENVSDWAVEAVRWALANNIVSYTFNPKAAASRAWTAHVMTLA